MLSNKGAKRELDQQGKFLQPPLEAHHVHLGTESKDLSSSGLLSFCSPGLSLGAGRGWTLFAIDLERDFQYTSLRREDYVLQRILMRPSSSLPSHPSAWNSQISQQRLLTSTGHLYPLFPELAPSNFLQCREYTACGPLILLF
jgi:hypothetical protein